MKFYYEAKEYNVDVEKLFAEATPDDYDADLYDNGVKIKDFPGIADFTDCDNVSLYYDPANNIATIQLGRDDYTVIREVEVSTEEMELIKDNLTN